jgi:thiol-disulfide isomerase/thioredoxin
MLVFLFTFTLLLLSLVRAGVVELSSEAELVQSLRAQAAPVATAFVEFFAPWCQHCRQFAPVWLDFAARIDSFAVLVGTVDATLPQLADWVRRLEVHQFPTLVLFRLLPNDVLLVTPYRGPRLLDSLAAFTLRHANKAPVRELVDEAQYESFVAPANDATTRLVLFVRGDDDPLLLAAYHVAAALYVEHSAFAVARARLSPAAIAEDAAGALLILSQDAPITEAVADATAIGDLVLRNRFGVLPCGSNGRLSELVRGISILVALIAPAPRPTAREPAADAEFGRHVAALADSARAMRRASPAFQFVYVNANDAAHARWLTIVGVKAPVLEAQLIVVRVGSGVVYRAPFAPLAAANQVGEWIFGVSDEDDDDNAVAAGEMSFAGNGDTYVRHVFGYQWRKRPLVVVLGGAALVALILFAAYRFVVRAPRDDDDDDADANDDGSGARRRPRVVDIKAD